MTGCDRRLPLGKNGCATSKWYESMGGWETLSAAVLELYTRMRDDPRCASLFAEANEQSLKTHMLEFLTCALGGKARFASSTLLTNQRDQLRSHGFGAVLEELGLHQEVAASAIALLRCHKYLFEKRASESAEEDVATPALDQL
ncbi:hypothetical protein GPECTOR_54g208 [Gonium pectorale]|uniref:Uncharacterized protein n=1 Tax=Gonium pectorale TaxID=33097 RepID=A0A150G6J4_GONPE|nr:hypothetical protein GPECTOR_54g208 [Gonium pectorale]|eukprot:KXZ45467.1 hypothetical protein GPECTOR_54g208 [Gonium pectorale]